MADPRIYLYPAVSGSLEEIDFGEGLSDIQEMPVAEVEDAYSGDYTPYRSFLGASLRVRIVLERFGSPGSSALERKLQTLQSHLQRGGVIGFSRDHAKTWASVTSSPPTRGDLTVYTGGNGFTAWAPLGAPAAGDEIVIESPPPTYLREIGTCGALTVSPPLHLPLASPGAVFTYASAAVVRWRDFYPVLWLPKDQVSRPIVTHDHRRNFTLDATFEYNPATVLALWGEQGSAYEAAGSGAFGNIRNMSGPALRKSGSAPGFGGMSMEQLLAGVRTSRPALDRAKVR